MNLARRTLRLSNVHIYGFRQGCCPELVTEILRQLLFQGVKWNKPVYILSADIRTAFDDMGHARIFEALLARGVHPTIAKAIILEYLDLVARVNVADADPSGFFQISKGGRQGGVETPELFNLIVKAGISGVVQQWSESKFGFSLDGKSFISHCIWADNCFLIAKSRAAAELMAEELTNEIHAKGFRWKVSSSECLCGANFSCELISCTSAHGETFSFKLVEELLALGTLLDRRGSTSTSVSHRMVQADKSFYKHFVVLSDLHGGLRQRLQSFHGCVGQALLYGSGGWQVTPDVLSRVRAWENNKLPKMLRLRRAPDEGRASYNIRTANRIANWFESLQLPRLHHELLMRVHSWASKLTSFKLPYGEQPLKDLLMARSAQHWSETRDGNIWLDASNVTGWRHARGGKQVSAWESALVATYGLCWWTVFDRDRQLWACSRKDFVNKFCALAGLSRMTTGKHDYRQVNAAVLSVPTWTDDDFNWEKLGESFECRVDNAALAQWTSGTATFDTEAGQWRSTQVFEHLRALVRTQSWNFRYRVSSWVVWVPRERNRLADHLANLALDRKTSYTVGGLSSVDSKSHNFVTLSDEAARGSSATAAAAWAIIAMRGLDVSIVAAGALLLQEGTSSLMAESRALELALMALLRLSRDHVAICPHSYSVVIPISELSGEILQDVIKNSGSEKRQ